LVLIVYGKFVHFRKCGPATSVHVQQSAPAHRGEKGERGDDDDDGRRGSRQKSCRLVGRVPIEAGTVFFGGKMAGDCENRERDAETADEHRRAQRKIVEERVGRSDRRKRCRCYWRRTHTHKRSRFKPCGPGVGQAGKAVAVVQASAEPKQDEEIRDENSHNGPSRLPRLDFLAEIFRRATTIRPAMKTVIRTCMRMP